MWSKWPGGRLNWLINTTGTCSRSPTTWTRTLRFSGDAGNKERAWSDNTFPSTWEVECCTPPARHSSRGKWSRSQILYKSNVETTEILSFLVNTISNQVMVPFLRLTYGCCYPGAVPFLCVVYVKRLSDVLTFESLLRTPKLCVEASADDSSVGDYLLP